MTVSTASFDGAPFPPDVAASILNTGLAGAPVFNALTRRVTSRSKVTFPTGAPTGFNWSAELGTLPSVTPGDDSAVFTPAKIGGLVLLSNESIGDSNLNISDEVGRLIAESMAVRADVEMLYGSADTPTPNAAAPAGYFAGLTSVSEATLRESVVAACSAIMTAGGNPNTVLLSPALWAAEVNRREETTASAGMLNDLGIPLNVIVAPTLKATDGLVLDTSGCFAIVRDDFSVEASSQAGDAWSRDALSLRVTARLATAIPAKAKHARSIAVDAAPAGP